MPNKKYPRVLLKLSGESLGLTTGSNKGEGVSAQTVQKLARELAAVNKKGIALAIVIGGGNLWRFRDNQGLKSLPRESSDYLGMLATVFNATVLAAELNKLKIKTEAFSAVAAPKIIKKYTPAAASQVLNAGGVVVLAGGTGRPYVTTDTGAAMRAIELKCTRVLKATNVDGVYSADPRKDKKAKLFTQLTYAEILVNKLAVMDEKAFRLMQKAKMPLTVFNFNKKGLLLRAARGYNVGTIISTK
jgi:uridylate kinase